MSSIKSNKIVNKKFNTKREYSKNVNAIIISYVLKICSK